MNVEHLKVEEKQIQILVILITCITTTNFSVFSFNLCDGTTQITAQCRCLIFVVFTNNRVKGAICAMLLLKFFPPVLHIQKLNLLPILL